MRDMKQRKGNNGTKMSQMQEWKLRETETVVQCCRGWKMRHMNIRERQGIGLNTGKRGHLWFYSSFTDMIDFNEGRYSLIR